MTPLARAEFLLTHGPIIVAREHPQQARSVRRWHQRGMLTQVAPGIYVIPQMAADPRALMIAGAKWQCGAVYHGEAAGYLHGLVATPPTTFDLAVTSGVAGGGAFRVSQRTIPSEYRTFVQGLPVTTVALTAVDLAAHDEGHAIDAALRAGLVTPADLWDALAATPNRPGNTGRRQIVARSVSNPWSHAERRLHATLDAAGITGWHANFRIRLSHATYLVDVVFPRSRLVLEVDGFEFHSTRAAFESDRVRHNDLVLAGWTVLHFTPAMVDDAAYVETTVRAALSCPDSVSRHP